MRTGPGGRRSGGARGGLIKPAKNPVVLHGEAINGGGRHPPALPLSRSAPSEAAPQPGATPQNHSGNSQGHGRNGLYRSGNAHADAFNSGRRARFSCTQPRTSRAILRAAAIAANFQTDTDDRRAGQILPNRKM